MPNYECPRCEFTTDREAKMEVHIERKYPCINKKSDVVLKMSNINDYIVNESIYICNICNFSFNTKYYLDRHTCSIETKETIITSINKNKLGEITIKEINKTEINKKIDNKLIQELENELKIIKEKYKIFFDQIDDINDNRTNERKQLSAALRYKVWNKYIGQQIGIHKCFCCNDINITQQSFECGHIISVANGGLDSVKNLRPICSLCNKSMGSIAMNIFIKTLE